MGLIFNFPENKLAESIHIVHGFKLEGVDKRMYFNFPFSESEFADINKILKTAEEEFLCLEGYKIKKNIESYLSAIQEQLNSKIKEYEANENLSIHSEYFCVLTPYGPHGYYELPNTIFINISKGSIEFMVETLLHEMLHIALNSQLSELPENQIEAKVDSVFVSLFGDLFPNYYVQ